MIVNKYKNVVSQIWFEKKGNSRFIPIYRHQPHGISPLLIYFFSASFLPPGLRPLDSISTGLMIMEAWHRKGPGKGLNTVSQFSDASNGLWVLKKEVLEVLKLCWGRQAKGEGQWWLYFFFIAKAFLHLVFPCATYNIDKSWTKRPQNLTPPGCIVICLPSHIKAYLSFSWRPRQSWSPHPRIQPLAQSLLLWTVWRSGPEHLGHTRTQIPLFEIKSKDLQFIPFSFAVNLIFLFVFFSNLGTIWYGWYDMDRCWQLMGYNRCRPNETGICAEHCSVAKISCLKTTLKMWQCRRGALELPGRWLKSQTHLINHDLLSCLWLNWWLTNFHICRTRFWITKWKRSSENDVKKMN